MTELYDPHPTHTDTEAFGTNKWELAFRLYDVATLRALRLAKTSCRTSMAQTLLRRSASGEGTPKMMRELLLAFPLVYPSLVALGVRSGDPGRFMLLLDAFGGALDSEVVLTEFTDEPAQLALLRLAIRARRFEFFHISTGRPGMWPTADTLALELGRPVAAELLRTERLRWNELSEEARKTELGTAGRERAHRLEVAGCSEFIEKLGLLRDLRMTWISAALAHA